MKRLTRRAVAVVVGIALGWYAGGWVGVGQWSVIPGAGVGANYAHASDTEHDPHDSHDDHGHAAEEHHDTHNDHASTAGDDHGTHDSHDDHGDHGGHGGGGHEGDAALDAAEQLVPRAEDIPWFKPVLYTAGGLFVAAVVLGIPALKLRGPEEPDPADHADTHSH